MKFFKLIIIYFQGANTNCLPAPQPPCSSAKASATRGEGVSLPSGNNPFRELKNIIITTMLLLLFPFVSSCRDQQMEIRPGACQTLEYLPLLQGKSVALVVNHTSLIDQTHLADSLLDLDINIIQIFSPEHGFRGNEDAGALVKDGVDPRTGLTVVSLYGSHKKPQPEDLENIDIVVFDLQDVGVRFFTYISTLYYVMEACAENDIPIIVLDRPNPNGDYVAGAVLDMDLKSFVGILPLPVVYGLTMGELAGMINGEGWLKDNLQCDLRVIRIKNWDHNTHYELPVKPSPNLPNYQSVRLYPSLCIFEGTNMSVGRGTMFPFQVIGYPDSTYGSFTFTPESIKGMAMNPKHKNERCYGMDLRNIDPPKFTLHYFFDYLRISNDSTAYLERPEWIEMLMGDPDFIEKVKAGQTEAQITESWQADLNAYLLMRKKYLLYPDFDAVKK
ncbi:exo-beta-N-acetylmuramidase NamZ domain-containing protein [Saccharicrinis sp. FJH54]|uniref:exo-beta-N-acetylmuramidase NamZ family protein n=1 Tax=Saccharicrinis sp. FJH54 TaxID=3344665 RepID=UPI0035D4092A